MPSQPLSDGNCFMFVLKLFSIEFLHSLAIKSQGQIVVKLGQGDLKIHFSERLGL